MDKDLLSQFTETSLRYTKSLEDKLEVLEKRAEALETEKSLWTEERAELARTAEDLREDLQVFRQKKASAQNVCNQLAELLVKSGSVRGDADSLAVLMDRDPTVLPGLFLDYISTGGNETLVPQKKASTDSNLAKWEEAVE